MNCVSVEAVDDPLRLSLQRVCVFIDGWLREKEQERRKIYDRGIIKKAFVSTVRETIRNGMSIKTFFLFHSSQPLNGNALTDIDALDEKERVWKKRHSSSFSPSWSIELQLLHMTHTEWNEEAIKSGHVLSEWIHAFLSQIYIDFIWSLLLFLYLIVLIL